MGDGVDVPDELLAVLDELIAAMPLEADVSGRLVDEDGRWTRWLSESRRRIAAGDPRGIGHLVSAYGGMGSINDLMVDRGVGALLSRAFTLAKDTARELRRFERGERP